MSRPRTALRRLTRELLLACLLLIAGVGLLPAAVYHTGSRLFGPYELDGGGMGVFYAELLDQLADGSAVAWALVLSPWLCVSLCRLAVALWRARPAPPVATGTE